MWVIFVGWVAVAAVVAAVALAAVVLWPEKE
jgi:hypothetical protein